MTPNNDLTAFIRNILGTTRLATENDDVTDSQLDEAAGILSAALAVTGMLADREPRASAEKKTGQGLIKHGLVQLLTLDDLAVIGRDAWELKHETQHAIPEQHTMTRTWQPGDLYEYRWAWTTQRAPDVTPDADNVQSPAENEGE